MRWRKSAVRPRALWRALSSTPSGTGAERGVRVPQLSVIFFSLHHVTATARYPIVRRRRRSGPGYRSGAVVAEATAAAVITTRVYLDSALCFVYLSLLLLSSPPLCNTRTLIILFVCCSRRLPPGQPFTFSCALLCVILCI